MQWRLRGRLMGVRFGNLQNIYFWGLSCLVSGKWHAELHKIISIVSTCPSIIILRTQNSTRPSTSYHMHIHWRNGVQWIYRVCNVFHLSWTRIRTSRTSSFFFAFHGWFWKELLSSTSLLDGYADKFLNHKQSYPCDVYNIELKQTYETQMKLLSC